MKVFFMKIFLMIAAIICMFEGLALVMAGLGRLPSEKLLDIYNRLAAHPKALQTMLGAGLLFALLGFILLLAASRSKPAQKMIAIEIEGKMLSVPQTAIRGFVKQILGKNPYMSNFTVDFERKGKRMTIRIISSFKGITSVHQELIRIECVLRSEIERVFEWKDFDLDFQLRSVSVDPHEEYFGSGERQPKNAKKQKDAEKANPEAARDNELDA